VWLDEGTILTLRVSPFQPIELVTVDVERALAGGESMVTAGDALIR
jgi:hypothetical protein